MLRIFALGTLGVYWITIFVGTHLPDGVPGIPTIPDKILHFGAYAGLAFLLAAALTLVRLRHGSLFLPMVIAAVYGCVDELSQLAVPGRNADVMDWAADVFGAGLGVLAFGVLALVVARFFAASPVAPTEAITETAAAITETAA